MIEIKLGGKPTSVKEGTRVVDLLSPEARKKYLVCRIGSQIKEMNYKLTERDNGRTVYLLGLKNKEAGKAYEATLRYLIAMAFHTLYPGVQIRFSYNVSRSVFCEALTPNFNMFSATEQIKAEVARLIAADLPFERVTCSEEEAKQFYQQEGYEDKIEMLAYRPENTVHLYKCGDYYNYMHSYMVASTGCLSRYTIVPYSPGLIIQYPRYELGANIPEFVEESTYGKVLQKTYQWAKKANLQTVADINHHVEQGRVLDLVQLCEAKHSNMLAELGENIEKEIDNIRLICIAGPSSSGKTTFCNRLRVELLSRGINPVMISMDDYYLEKDQIARIQKKPITDLDLEHINCLDIQQFNRDMFALINHEEVTLPLFNFRTGKRERGRTIRVDARSPIIIEGIHALNEKLTVSIPKHQKYKIYIAPQAQVNIDNHSPLNITDLRLIRRIIRDMKFRNSPAATTIGMWQSVRDGEFKWIYPNQEGADYVFNSFLGYELCVMRTEALPALQKISPNDPQYLVAHRLINYLKYFRPIEDESIIPCNSLMREFIGGSCFDV